MSTLQWAAYLRSSIDYFSSHLPLPAHLNIDRPQSSNLFQHAKATFTAQLPNVKFSEEFHNVSECCYSWNFTTKDVKLFWNDKLFLNTVEISRLVFNIFIFFASRLFTLWFIVQRIRPTTPHTLLWVFVRGKWLPEGVQDYWKMLQIHCLRRPQRTFEWNL